ncbi:VIT domain-containing protein [Flammeovirga sp. EKP202]|uniref:VIT domain-containing protein n=1 Tax=Flammeovirga sp. EKP202 TaxID=2770592 RepID=UPI00165F9FC9|nr:VIT domain-containing protein [Flammeovirga sp. EKP202]MBD0405446.1 carboxypeptidase-like regulatory domain-containing protein [Flammeovirga sp. EKP202]
MKVQLLLLFLLTSFTLKGQIITIGNAESKGDSVALKKLYIDVLVVDNIATTKMEMHFYNYGSRVLEGELNFPLEQGATVSAFSLDIGGEWREGVVVKKEKATEVFENIVRQNVDPAIVEKTVGNNFKTRVYPIFPKEYKKCIVAFDQELRKNDKGDILYHLPMYYKNLLKEFEVHVEIINKSDVAVGSDNALDIQFQDVHESTIANYTAKDTFVQSNLSFTLPQKGEAKKTKSSRGKFSADQFFYVQSQPEAVLGEKKKPSSITFLWDVSAHYKGRNLEKEKELIKEYFKWNKNVSVEVKTFNYEVTSFKKFQIKDGNTSKLLRYIDGLEYDGGCKLDAYLSKNITSEEVWLFSDGISNLAQETLFIFKQPLYTISSSSSVNQAYLSALANQNSGDYLNLSSRSQKALLQKIKQPAIRFLGIEVIKGEVAEVYPSKVALVKKNFAIAGKLNSEEATLKINYGIGGKIMSSEQVTIQSSDKKYEMVEKLWAQKQIDELSELSKQNEEVITNLALKYGIVTDFTSFIVLDNLEDYVTHEIIPPTSMLKDYYAKLKEKNDNKTKEINDRKDRIYASFQADITWWEESKDMSEVIREEKLNKPKSMGQNNQQSLPDREYVTEKKVVYGIVRESGVNGVLPGTNVVLRGTDHGTVTDFDGKFSIEVPLNGILVFSSIGYQSQELDVTNIGSRRIRIIMEEDNDQLEEVVVIGYSRQTTARTQAVESVPNEQEVMMGVAVDFDEETVTEEMEESDSWGGSADEAADVKRKRKPKKTVKTTLIPYESDARYLEALKSTEKTRRPSKYYELKKKYKNAPSFYYDVASFFYSEGDQKMAFQVLSNLAEIDLENHEVLRNLGRKLQEFERYEEAEYIFKKLIDLRPFEPQNYRDLALLYVDKGEYQKAVDQYYSIIESEWSSDIIARFGNIELIILHEMNNLITKYPKQIDTSKIDARFIHAMPLDVRIVIDWDMLDTDIDLWVIDPINEKCFYSHKDTRIGGKMSNDFTRGYGPEEFRLKHAIEGQYIIKVNYYGSSKQSLFGPVTLRTFLYTSYSNSKEERQELSLQLKQAGKSVYEVGSLDYKIAN